MTTPAFLLSSLLLLVSAPAAQDSADEPAAERPEGVTVRRDGAFDGFTLFSPLRSTSVYLIDMAGEVVHEWETDGPPGNSVYLMDDGMLLRCGRIEEGTGFRGGGIGGRLQFLGWDGEVLWDFRLADETRHAHHDVEPLPNGNVLFIVWERMSREEALAVGRAPDEVDQDGLWPDAILEVRPLHPDGGEVVWEWHARDHLIQDTDEALAGHGSIPDSPGRIDVNADHRDEPPLTPEEREEREELAREMEALGYLGGGDDEEDDEDDEDDDSDRRRGGDFLHTNSVDYHPELDLILLSTPRLGEIWILDHSTTTEEARGSTGGRFGRGGELLYRWGNPRAFGAGSRADQRLFAQHDAQWIPAGSPGAGNVLVFNNGRGRPGGDASSVDELVLPLTDDGFAREPGGAFGPREPVWSYPPAGTEGFYASFISGCQRLPNGNTLVCSGPPGRLFEVTPDGRPVWEYWNPFGGEVTRSGPPPPGDGGPPPADRVRPSPVALFRATRLAPDHPGLAGRLER